VRPREKEEEQELSCMQSERTRATPAMTKKQEKHERNEGAVKERNEGEENNNREVNEVRECGGV
jgi:hypothetical protein